MAHTFQRTQSKNQFVISKSANESSNDIFLKNGLRRNVKKRIRVVYEKVCHDDDDES